MSYLPVVLDGRTDCCIIQCNSQIPCRIIFTPRNCAGVASNISEPSTSLADYRQWVILDELYPYTGALSEVGKSRNGMRRFSFLQLIGKKMRQILYVKGTVRNYHETHITGVSMIQSGSHLESHKLLGLWKFTKFTLDILVLIWFLFVSFLLTFRRPKICKVCMKCQKKKQDVSPV